MPMVIMASMMACHAFLVFPPPSHHPHPTRIRPYHHQLVVTPMNLRRVYNTEVEVREYYSVTEIKRDGNEYVMSTTKFSSDEAEEPMTWIVRHRYDQLDDFQRRLNGKVSKVITVVVVLLCLQ